MADTSAVDDQALRDGRPSSHGGGPPSRLPSRPAAVSSVADPLEGDSIDYGRHLASSNGDDDGPYVGFDDNQLYDADEDDEDALFAAFDDTVDLLDSERTELERLTDEVDRRRRRKKPSAGSR